ncbi:carbamoyltransferase HypF [Archaeoglobus neptunius]|uniref:carbamoyltransferase HypF n=1 Tax=Archaeoglobus neptunius TaxID=2798580 RepID=UPI001928D659|nr:carbamoyltransferase HypF [Archaeoglobus neptunius]
MFKITVRGTVQGVGFRPFVHRIALNLGLRGYVKNTGDGSVEIVVDRDPDSLIRMLRDRTPPAVKIDDVVVTKINCPLPESFEILPSGGKSTLSLPPPDMAVCGNCLKELFSQKDRRYLYPFISCTDCGARFSIVENLPFDRENTSLREFPMCEECRGEYKNVNDRRYYAQTIACGSCGPNYRFMGRNGERGGIEEASEAIESGEIIAIKGIGGYHIACLTEDETVAELRRILKRPQQPFAVMARNINAIESVSIVGEDERDELSSIERPIVVLRKKEPEIFKEVAPGLDTVGMMLPYAPVHYLLFSNMKVDFMVMTSANLPGEPMYIDEGVFNLDLDGYLVHNLKISNRVDDSVVKFCAGTRMIVRRSRGFVPKALNMDVKGYALAVGAELYNSIAVLREGKAVVSQYIGNTYNFKTYSEFFKKTVDFFLRFFRMKEVDNVVSDMHPLFNTTMFAEKLAEKLNARHIRVQHHFSHALSVMAEKKLSNAVAIAVDGVGYGMDGSVWGGEVLYIDIEGGEFRRVGRLESFELIGGDAATMRPVRILVSLLSERPELLDHYSRYEDVHSLLKLLPYAVKTTSAGRFLDAASAMLEICTERTYEGEPAMKLEAAAEKYDLGVEVEVDTAVERAKFETPFKPEGRSGKVRVLKVRDFFGECTERYLRGEKRSKIAYEIFAYLASGFATIAAEFAVDCPVIVCGGVAYNRHFTEILKRELPDIIVPSAFPAGDNGISIGQLYSLKILEGDDD